ncbi:MAG: hypothetical protein HY038_06705 [Nitrospirae bacterium]|nr:hypothetical protein [Nitrospirota bacterium]
MGRHALVGRLILTGVGLVVCFGCGAFEAGTDRGGSSNLQRAKTFLAAADYRRAIEACQKEVTERPSATSYVYLTYVYQALDAYLDSLVRSDRWVLVEQLALSLSPGRPEDLLDSPDVLARIAKELIQESTRKQSDAAAAMATRLDAPTVGTLWTQQKRWRDTQPDGWWLSVPLEWGW